jgi:peptidyl-prolyl cis-trans isomerase SurA
MQILLPIRLHQTLLGCPILAVILGEGRRGDRSRRTCFSYFRRKGGRAQTHPEKNRHTSALFCTLLLSLTVWPSHAQSPNSSAPVVLDRVVAVVNNQAILDSDIDDEIRLSVLDPGRVGMGVLTRSHALDQLIGRDLIQQQIRQEDLESAEPTQAEVDARLSEIRRQLPSCIRSHCSTGDGWKAFLVLHNLTEERVEAYLRYRVEILRFIEQRFRQGINVQPKEIETYYNNTLLPQYPKGETIPPLDQVSSRIQEILLQQQVNILFDDWLNNLRNQGNIEVLDPTIQDPTIQGPAKQNPASQDPTIQEPAIEDPTPGPGAESEPPQPQPPSAAPNGDGKGSQ